MTKQDVINQVSVRTGLEAPLIRVVLESFFAVVKDALTEGDPIYIRTFGSFTLKRRASKTARNISQNTTVKIAAQVIPSFKASREFVDQVRAQEVTGEKKRGKAKG